MDLETHEVKLQFQHELKELPEEEFQRRFREATDREYPFFLAVSFERYCDNY